MNNFFFTLILAEILFWTVLAVLWVIVLPIAWILATPYILIVSFFDRQPYFTSLLSKYRRIADKVSDIGIEFSP